MILFKILISYVIGSIPTAYLFGRYYKGIDIREHGSGNVGATNVFRVLGKGPGIIVLILDILKGFVAVKYVPLLFGLEGHLAYLYCSVAVVCGHNWTLFLRFKGGKGIATSLGVLIALAVSIPSVLPVLVMTLLLWLSVFLTLRFVSLASIVAAIGLPIFMMATRQPLSLILMAFIFSFFVVFRHKSNISRLRRGEEPRVQLFNKN